MTVEEKYPLLIGHSLAGRTRLHNIQEVANFICTHGQYRAHRLGGGCCAIFHKAVSGRSAASCQARLYLSSRPDGQRKESMARTEHYRKRFVGVPQHG